LIEQLPAETQPFLNAGGWAPVTAVLGLVSLALLVTLVRGLLRRRRRALPRPELDLTEDLSTYPPPPALWGKQRLTLHGLAVRTRLIVIAPLGTEAGEVAPDQVEQLLDQVVPGISQVLRGDKPRIRIWPTQLSYAGFQAAFRRHTQRPEAEHQVSRWVLLIGKAFIARRPIALGFAFLANQDNTLGHVILDHPHQWMEALRLQT
jgi:hypothetical protein